MTRAWSDFCGLARQAREAGELGLVAGVAVLGMCLIYAVSIGILIL